MNDEQCRLCLLREAGEKSAYEQVKQCLERIRPEEKAAPELYSARLKLCKECENLISGTCMKCGCYVELRAAFAKNKCPLAGKKRKW